MYDIVYMISSESGSVNAEYIENVATSLIKKIKEYDGGRGVYQEVVNAVRASGSSFDIGAKKNEGPIDYEEKRPINGKYTDITTKRFTKDVNKQKLIVNLTYRLYDAVINKYCDLINIPRNMVAFIYKGGNVLRFIFQQSLKELPDHTSDEIYEKLCKYFKLSDNDYSILLSNSIDDYDNVFRNITAVAYLTLCALREHISRPKSLFALYDYYGKVHAAKKTVLSEEVGEIKELIKKIMNADLVSISHCAGLPNSDGQVPTEKFYFDEPQPQPQPQPEPVVEAVGQAGGDPYEEYIEKYPDIVILNDGANEGYPDETKNMSYELSQLGMEGKTSPFRASMNTGIVFEKVNGRGEKTITRFNLVRTKCIFPTEVRYKDGSKATMSFAGEHVDISIPYKTGLDLHALTTYSDKSFDMTFMSYDYNHYIDDLNRMLFIETLYPWEDVKYVKRLVRIIYMFCFDMMFYKDHADPNIQNIGDVVKIMNEIYETLGKMKDAPIESMMSHIEKLNGLITSEKVRMKEFFKRIGETVQTTQKNPEAEREHLLDFLDNIRDYVHKMFLIFTRVKEYIDSGGSVDVSNVYDKKTGGYNPNFGPTASEHNQNGGSKPNFDYGDETENDELDFTLTDANTEGFGSVKNLMTLFN